MNVLVIMVALATISETPTSDQIKACLVDALKYCKVETVDRHDVVACLMKHRRELSPTCAAAFSAAGR